MNFDADLDKVFFADFGVAASIGAATTKGIFDTSTVDGMGHSEAAISGLTKTFLFKAGALGTCANKTLVDIAGKGTFKIVDSRLEDDGNLQKIYLADA